MKRYLALLLVTLLLVGLFGCAGGGNGETTAPTESEAVANEPLLVGYGRADITPNRAVPLGGYGNSQNRYSTEVRDSLYVTCIAVTCGQDTALLITQDLLYGYDTPTAEARMQIMLQLKVIGTRVMICGTHTHSGPDLGSNNTDILAYREMYYAGVVEAARQALEDRVPAEIYGTKVQTEGLNFIRHYIREDGTYTGSNFGSQSKAPIAEHAEEGDPEMQLVRFAREGKKDILLMNWQAHPCYTSGSTVTVISADYIATIRDKVEGSSDMLFAFFAGATGNQNARSLIAEEKHNLTVEQYGDTLGQLALDAVAGMKKVEGSGIKTSKQTLTLAVNHDGEDKLTQAQEVAKLFSKDGVVATANQLAWQYGFSSVYEANAITQRINWPAEDTFEIDVMNIGGLAFVFAPYEMFSGSGKYIKENSPFDMTIVASCANASKRYFPTENAYDYGAYEAVTSYFAKGCAEATAKKFVEMLKEIK